jgi:excisionase family DNA binding protein
MPHYMTTTAVAAYLGVSIWTVYRLVEQGVLQPVRLSPRGRLRFRAEDVERLLEPEVPVGARPS